MNRMELSDSILDLFGALANVCTVREDDLEIGQMVTLHCSCRMSRALDAIHRRPKLMPKWRAETYAQLVEAIRTCREFIDCCNQYDLTLEEFRSRIPQAKIACNELNFELNYLYRVEFNSDDEFGDGPLDLKKLRHELAGTEPPGV